MQKVARGYFYAFLSFELKHVDIYIKHDQIM